MTQTEKRNLFGRSVRLDIVAIDSAGQIYNIEIQRADKGAVAKRVRYNMAMLDSHTLKKNEDFENLPNTYIIFITEHDYLGLGKPVYKVEKYFDAVDSHGEHLPFDDGCTIMYVNGSYRGNDSIGKLMHDFCATNADEMYYGELAEKVRFHKQETKGAETMCRIFEEYGNERAAEGKTQRSIEVAENLLRDGTLPIEKIATLADVPLEQVKSIAEKIAGNANR